MKTLYLIGGTMGVGKSTVCRYCKKLLANSVFLDGDWCWDAHPFRVTDETKEMVMQNICALLGNFLKCSVYENVIFCWVMHEQSIINEILSRLTPDGCRVVSISLTCSAQELVARLQADVREGLRAADVIPRSLERLPLYEQLDTVKLDTSGKTAEQVAQEIAALR